MKPPRIGRACALVPINHFVLPRRSSHGAGPTPPPPPPPPPLPSRRRSITLFDDDGHLPWTSLSPSEKATRATQQSFNWSLAAVGLILTSAVTYLVFTEIISPEGPTNQFNRAVERVRHDPRCIEVLGGRGRSIEAHGDETFNKWRKSRPISHTVTTDAQGVEHLVMRFYVEGPRNHGAVNLHMVRPPGRDEFDYRYLVLDVAGHERVYLEGGRRREVRGQKEGGFRLFGIRWR